MEKKVMLIAQHDERGFEIPDPTPMALPVNFTRPLTIQDMVRRYVRVEVSRAAEEAGEETFEESDDFEVGDDPEMRSPYELDDEQIRAMRTDFIEEELRAKPGEAPPKAGPEIGKEAPKVGPEDGPKATAGPEAS